MEKSSKKSQKEVKKEVKKEVQNENKKPPIKVVEQKETTKSENSKKSKKDVKEKKDIKNEKDSQKIKIEEIEKKMYEGQDHIEEKEVLKEKQEKQEAIEAKYEPPQPTIKEERKQAIVKPRETYLKEKIGKMNYNVNLLTNIQKEMGDKIKNIMKEDGVVVGEKTKDLKKYMGVKDKTRTEIENYENKKKYKEIKNLMDELKGLQINLKQLEENEKMLMPPKEKNSNKNSQEISNEKLILDKSQNLTKIREIQAKKEEVNEKIADINYRIKYSIEADKIQNIPNKERVKDFINNFERDKEIIEIRARKYFKEFKERSQRKQTDLETRMKKREEEIEKKKKEMDERNLEAKKKFKDDEIELEKKWTKMNQGILLKYKPYINELPKQRKQDYRYYISEKNFEKRILNQMQKKAEQYKKEKEKYTYKFEDIEKFSQEFDEKIENRRYEQEQKSMEFSQKWNENKEKLPKNNNYQSMQNLNRKKILEEEKKLETNKENVKKLLEDIRENYSPEVDIKKRKQLQAVIHALEDPKNAAKKYTLKKQKKNRIILKKRDTTKPSKFKWELKLDPNPNKEENYIKKPKKINLLPIMRTTTEIPVKKPDYLQEMINKKKKIRSNSSKGRDNYEDEFYGINEKAEKWETVMNKKDINLLDNINNVQSEVEILEKKAEEKEKLLKLKGGIENNPELGKQVSSLLIDSIEAKINMIKKMNDAQK